MSEGTGPFDIGDEVTVEAVFTKRADKSPVEPDEAQATALRPDGEVVELTPVPQDPPDPDGPVNTYRVEIEPDLAGDWTVRFAGTGEATAAEEIVFSVRRRRVPAAP